MNRRRFLRQGSSLASLAVALGAGGTATSVLAQAADGASALEKVRARGRLIVGVYQELPPFHVDGKGIEVELARALAGGLGVQTSVLPFTAGENMSDDLRNMVWRGHYLGWGPADVLLHVPVDRPLIDSSPQVEIFGPYWRERVVIARDLSVVPKLDGLDDLKNRRIAVPGLSLAGWLMIGAENGRLREQLVTDLPSGVDAAQLLRKGEVPVAAGLRSELESVLRDDPRYAITPLPIPRAPRDGWAVGMAVKRSAGDLARALQGTLNDLAEQGKLREIFASGGLAWQKV
ncbi:ABC transporter substrate-binding protein [Leptothrix sp. BB-4]